MDCTVKFINCILTQNVLDVIWEQRATCSHYLQVKLFFTNKENFQRSSLVEILLVMLEQITVVKSTFIVHTLSAGKVQMKGVYKNSALYDTVKSKTPIIFICWYTCTISPTIFCIPVPNMLEPAVLLYRLNDVQLNGTYACKWHIIFQYLSLLLFDNF